MTISKNEILKILDTACNHIKNRRKVSFSINKIYVYFNIFNFHLQSLEQFGKLIFVAQKKNFLVIQ